MPDTPIPPTDEPSWTGRVRFTDGHGGFAYRPRQLLVRTREGATRALDLLAEMDDRFGRTRTTELDDDWQLVEHDRVDESSEADEGESADEGEGRREGDVIVDGVLAELSDEGYVAEPNYVLFADGCECECGCGGGGSYANPVYANPVYANPVYANPVYANPVYANGVRTSAVLASPVYANPVYANAVERAEYRATGRRTHSARPADGLGETRGAKQDGRVVIFDTGLAVTDELPALLDRLSSTPRADREVPSAEGNDYLDPVAGHGTFITGLVELLCPGLDLTPVKVLQPEGDGDQLTIGQALLRAQVDERTILNLSFSGYAPHEMRFLARAVRHVQRKGAVVVASTGNDGRCRRTYPACLPGVVSVAALGPGGPAPFSNHGPWVRACAPGVDVVSAFFRDFNGPIPPLAGSPDPDHFTGWARWSGTSFAAPIVAAALAREMVLSKCTAKEAVARVVDAPSLFRLPNLGTVVNMWPPGQAVPQ